MPETTLLFELTGKEGDYRVTHFVDEQPLGLEARFEYDEAFEMAVKAQKVEKNKCNLDDLKFIGTELWQQLLVEDVAEFFATKSPLWGEGHPCHIRLRIKPPELEALPWECLYTNELGF